MIISQTPFRISFFGGGTDYPTWFREHGGAVLSTTIDKYCYITARNLPPFFEHKHRLAYSSVETVKEISELKHPSAREVMRYLKVTEGLEIHHDGDLPARSGIGSSSAFTVGLLNTLFAMRGSMVTKQELARLAIHIEQNIIKEAVGSQDQVATAFGGLNRITFNRDDTFGVQPVIMSGQRRVEFQKNLKLYFTGFSRTADKIARTQIANFGQRQAQLKAMFQMVDEGMNILQSKSPTLNDFGKLMHESWMLKRSLSTEVSSSEIDTMYEKALAAGATGGKLIGAGGGGFLLLFVQPEYQAKVGQALSSLLEVNFKFDTLGSRISLYEPELCDHIVERTQHDA